MDYLSLLDGLIKHERLMSRLYLQIESKFPAKREWLKDLSREEEMHASMLSSIREFFPANILTDRDIEITRAQLDRQVGDIKELMAGLKKDTLGEKEVVDRVFHLELSGAEFQLNRIVMKYKGDPYLETFAKILDADEAHIRFLEEWRSEAK